MYYVTTYNQDKNTYNRKTVAHPSELDFDEVESRQIISQVDTFGVFEFVYGEYVYTFYYVKK